MIIIQKILYGITAKLFEEKASSEFQITTCIIYFYVINSLKGTINKAKSSFQEYDRSQEEDSDTKEKEIEDANDNDDSDS